MSRQGTDLHPTSLPENPSKWVADAKRTDDLIQKIHMRGIQASAQYQKISGSNITFPHYLILRSIWQVKPANQLKVSEWLPQQDLDSARQYLNQSAWKEYIDRIRNHGRAPSKLPVQDIGTFSLVHYHQTQVFRLDNSYEPNGETPKVNHFQPSGNPLSLHHSSDSEENERSENPGDPFTDSPLASKSGRPGQALRAGKGLFGETRPSRTSRPEDIAGQMEKLGLDESPSTSRGVIERAQTPESQGISEPSSLSTVSPLAAVSTPAAIDEQIVNVALVLLLNAISIFCPVVHADWTLHRRAFHIRNILEARTDGYLRHEAHDIPLAILEVKRYVRSLNIVKVQMQESAQMAAWIAEHPSQGELPVPKNRKASERTRVIIAQDHSEIYLTFATYSKEYEEYVRKGQGYVDKQGFGPFIVMHQFGPWQIFHGSEMKHLGEVLLAITIAQSLHSRI